MTTKILFALIAFTGLAHADAKADTKLRDDCSAKAPKNLEMSGRHEFIDKCVADAKKKRKK